MIVIFLNAFTFTNFLKLLLAVAESASPAMDSNFLPVKKRDEQKMIQHVVLGSEPGQNLILGADNEISL